MSFGEGINAEGESRILNKGGKRDEEMVDDTTDEEDEEKCEEEVIEGGTKNFLVFFTSSAHTVHLAFSVLREKKKAKLLQRKNNAIKAERRESYSRTKVNSVPLTLAICFEIDETSSRIIVIV